MFDSMARRYRTTPGDLLGMVPGSWGAVIVNYACYLSGLGRWSEAVADLALKKAMIVHNIPLDGGP